MVSGGLCFSLVTGSTPGMTPRLGGGGLVTPRRTPVRDKLSINPEDNVARESSISAKQQQVIKKEEEYVGRIEVENM